MKFRKYGFYPAYAFEVEISIGVWTAFGRLATLRDYDARPYIVTNADKKFWQVITQFPEIKNRFIHVILDQVGLLYSAEKNLINMRKEFNLITIMKNYQVILTKSYIVTMKAESASKAKQLAEFYTGDISDISTDQARKEHNFRIEQIACGMNEGFDINEIHND